MHIIFKLESQSEVQKSADQHLQQDGARWKTEFYAKQICPAMLQPARFHYILLCDFIIKKIWKILWVNDWVSRV